MMATTTTMSVEQAAKLFVDRQDRIAHPDGRQDKGGRWGPSQDEWRECCNAVRGPSRAWPWSLMVHCRTAQHIASLTGVSATEIRREARKIRAERDTEDGSIDLAFAALATSKRGDGAGAAIIKRYEDFDWGE